MHCLFWGEVLDRASRVQINYVSVNKIKFESNRMNELILLIVSTHGPVHTNLMALVYTFIFPAYS